MRRSKMLDRGSEEMILYPEKLITDANGDKRKVPDLNNPKKIRINVSTDRQSSAELNGQIDNKVVKGITRSMPPGTWALVKFRGETWDLAIPETISNFTKRTRHVEFLLRSRNIKEVPKP